MVLFGNTFCSFLFCFNYGGVLAWVKRLVREHGVIWMACFYDGTFPGDDFFRFILLSNEKLTALLCQISSSKLIGTDPGNSFLSAAEGHFFNGEGDAMFAADLVSVVTIHDDPIPDGNRFAATVCNQVRLKLQVLVFEKGTNQLLEPFVYLKGIYLLLCIHWHIGSPSEKGTSVLKEKIAIFSEETILPVMR